MKKKGLLLLILLGVTFLAFLPIPRVYANPSYEDFTTYTELDPNNHIERTANHIDFISRKDETARLYKYKGENYFGTVFEHFLDIRLVEADTGGDFACVWAISNSLYNIQYWRDYSISYYLISVYRSATDFRIVLEEKNNGDPPHNDFGVISLNTWYYLRIPKQQTSLQCKIYSSSALRDIGGAPDIDTLSLTVTDNSFQYIFGCNTLNDGSPLQADVDIENLEFRFLYRYWSWDSTNKILTIIADAINHEGNTEGNGYDCEDIIDSGLVLSIYYNVSASRKQFEFNFRIIIGDGTEANTTWFADTDKQIIFNDGVVTANYQKLIDAQRSFAFLKFGVLEDASNKLGSQGISLISLESTYSNIWLIRANEKCYFYGCTFIGSKYSRFTSGKDGDYSHVYNCVFEGIDLYGTDCWLDVHDVTIRKAYGALYYVRGSFDTLRLYKNDYQIFLASYYPLTLRNVVASNPLGNFVRSLSITTDKYLINVDSDDWTFDWIPENTAEVYRQYEFDLAIFFHNGTSIQNANVTISNELLGSSNSWLSFSNGSIPQQIYSYGHYNQTGGDSIYNYNPYNVTVTLEGYETYTDMINITKKENLRICLCPIKASYGLGLGSGFILALMISIALLVAIVMISRRRS